MVSPASDAPPSDLPPSDLPPPSSSNVTYTLDGCERSGDELAQAGQHAEAVDDYKRALLLLGAERGTRRAELYVKLGECNHALGKARVAINHLSKALAVEPLHARAFELGIELTKAEKDYPAVDELLQGRIAALESSADKAKLWRESAELWLDQAKDNERGIAALEQWLVLEPKNDSALRRLVVAQRELKQYDRAVATLITLGQVLSGAEAAMIFMEAAKIAEQLLSDAAAAVALFERALASDPDHVEAYAAAERVLSAAGEWQRWCALCEQLASNSSDPARKLKLWIQAAGVAGEKLADMPRAELALARALELDDDDANLLRAMAEVRLAQGACDRAIVSCREALEVEPRSPESYQLAYQIFERAGNTDGCYNAAAVLDFLGDADINQSVLADAHRPEGLIAAQGVLGEPDWHAQLLFAERDARFQSLIDWLTPLAIEAKLELLRKNKKSLELDESERQDLQASTATLVRALQWSTRILGVEPPALYLRSEQTPEIMPAALATPTILASRTLGSGLSLKQLAFVWGRALTAVRPEHLLAAHFPSDAELAALLEAASLASRGKAASAENAELKALALGLEKALEPPRLEELSALLERIADPAEAAGEWLISVELACVRAGFLASGDLAEAAALCDRFPFGGETTPEQQVDELLEFAISDEYAALRGRLGVNVTA